MDVHYVDPAGSDANDGLSTNTAWATVASYIAGLRAMYAQRLVICVRDERDRFFFGVMTSFKETDARLQQHTADITISECSFRQGIS